MKRTIRTGIVLTLMAIGLGMMPKPAHAQVIGSRIAFGTHLGLSKYWGSFTDDRFWFGGDIYARWNIIPQLSLHAQFGLNELQYKVSDQDISQFPNYFGAPGDAFYPGTGDAVRREEINVIRANTYSLLASFNFITTEQVGPYIFGGIGMVNFNPRNKNQGFALPNNLSESYDKTQLIFPVGLGAELYVTRSLTLNVKGQLNLTQTDFLDDYSDGGSNDAFATFALGFSYYVFGKLDCDEDGLTDPEEERLGTDPCVADSDLDKLTDFEEVRSTGTDPLKADTDDDGLSDYRELRELDTDPRNPDTDQDGLKDGEELARKTDPKNPDTDGDGLTDGDEVLTHKTDPTLADTDKDGLWDGPEINQYATNPVERDTDGDELLDGDEIKLHKTNPIEKDSDGDGLTDGQEVSIYTTDPRNIDTDGDRLNDGDEVMRVKTNPLKPDTDGDQVIDGDDKCPLVPGVKERNGCPAPPKVGTITNFPDIYFIVNTDQFDFTRPQTDENLTKILAYVNQCPGLRVLVEGHASREGADKRNQELSEMRAERVKSWLIERGIAPEKIEGTVGYGSRRNAVQEPEPNSAEAKAMAPDALEALRKQNRRIAIRVMATCD